MDFYVISMEIKQKLDKINEVMHSRRGRNALTFLVFLLVSTVLWVVQSLNEETQRDMRCGVRVVNLPDSLVRVSPMPEAINVSVRTRGTDLLKYLWTSAPQMTIDYRIYKTSGNKIQFGDAALKAFFRNMFGNGALIQSVTPDSLSISYTSRPGVKMPVRLQTNITPAPQYIILGKPKALTDSVTIYSAEPLPLNMKVAYTQQVTLTDVRKSQTIIVPVAVPKGCRAIPDSIAIAFDVEPLISKTRKVPVTPVNVPADLKLIPVPSQIEVYYMVPMSIYKKSEAEPKFRVEADYSKLKNRNAEKIAIDLVYAPKDFSNVFLSTDSVDFILEQR